MRVLLPLAALALLAGCQQSGAIYVLTSTRNAVEISAAGDSSQTASIGHKRLEGVLMPARKRDGTVRPQAYSVLATYRFHQGSLLLANIGRLRIRQTFAVGNAARQEKAGESVTRLFAGEPAVMGCLPLAGSDTPVARIEQALRSARDAERETILALIQGRLGLSSELDADETLDALEPLRCTEDGVAKLNAVAEELR